MMIYHLFARFNFCFVQFVHDQTIALTNPLFCTILWLTACLIIMLIVESNSIIAHRLSLCQYHNSNGIFTKCHVHFEDIQKWFSEYEFTVIICTAVDRSMIDYQVHWSNITCHCWLTGNWSITASQRWFSCHFTLGMLQSKFNLY